MKERAGLARNDSRNGRAKHGLAKNGLANGLSTFVSVKRHQAGDVGVGVVVERLPLDLFLLFFPRESIVTW